MEKQSKRVAESELNMNVLDAHDILSHVSKTMDYLEDVSEPRISSLITILHAEIDKAAELLETRVLG